MFVAENKVTQMKGTQATAIIFAGHIEALAERMGKVDCKYS